jgi:hypothetical protein
MKQSTNTLSAGQERGKKLLKTELRSGGNSGITPRQSNQTHTIVLGSQTLGTSLKPKHLN